MNKTGIRVIKDEGRVRRTLTESGWVFVSAGVLQKGLTWAFLAEFLGGHVEHGSRDKSMLVITTSYIAFLHKRVQ